MKRRQVMSKLMWIALLLLSACAHGPAASPPIKVLILTRCEAACAPGETVQASLTVNRTDDLLECLCRQHEPPPDPGT
jgi:hypothetical protein